MNVTLLERLLIGYLVIFFGMRLSDDLLNATGIIDTVGMQKWPFYIVALIVAGLYLIIATAGKK